MRLYVYDAVISENSWDLKDSERWELLYHTRDDWLTREGRTLWGKASHSPHKRKIPSPIIVSVRLGDSVCSPIDPVDPAVQLR